MVFVACGISHKTAPLEVREKIALPLERQDTLLNQLVSLPAINEAAILSTCNRTEIYCDAENASPIISWLAGERQLNPILISPYFYTHQGHHGIRHTLRVASGLDSMMLGEPQILGQMKQAYQQGCLAGTVKNNLRQVFQYIFQASKRIRNRSGIGNTPVSVAFAAVQLISQFLPDFSSLRVLIIGSGETSSLVAKYLFKQGTRHFMVASRSHENAKQLATSLAGEALTITDIPQYLAKADVVISATACPLPFISKSLVAEAMHKRQHQPCFFLDLAVPRDIEPDVGTLANVHLYNIDDLHMMAEQGMVERRHAALHAEKLIERELDNYIRWHRTLKAKEIICDYRSQMQRLAEQELQRAKQKLAAGHCHHQVLDEFSQRLLKKLTHNPTVGLRQAAWDNRADILGFAQYLFNSSENHTS
ncbi:glutamyl-tRNA reductase [Legionella londiniensis]|uniref:Glutamyl-tRNA reductase n=1 Tax=Legionella londiniensis TaxID=45068 RepID=A0A0W0VSR4_9GAMM|nr:glutamyl-tRNA reductase [Legionella londiniensis]KTD23200.1 glutamyl tRNA reductase [Legionella londiniensis]STX93789.1 glutamyl tRNA reductase [Legionella londiniensis]